MADDVDEAAKLTDLTTNTNIDKIRKAAADIPEGVAGNCAKCGDYNPRLVLGNCAPCRDRFGLK